MAGLFADSSALAKRYIAEVGTAWVRALLDPTAGHEVFVARTTLAELIAAITRRERGGSIPPADADQARADFRADFASNYQPLEVTPALVEQAAQLAQTHGLRGYDAVQLAAALAINAVYVKWGQPPITLISSDVELSAIALKEGLQVEDPNTHP